MRMENLILVSIDDHVVEPRDMFDRHVPERWRARAPKVVMDDRGIERWVFEGQVSTSAGLNAVVSWPREEWGMDPTTFAEMRPGAYDIHERVRDMNRNGVLASMCFPSFVGFSNRFFQESPDRDLALVMTQAYNDWLIDEWCGSYPERFIPMAIPPVWDPQALAAELRRVARKGARAITMPELPHVQGLPSYNNLDHWDPFFRAAVEEQVVVCLHIGQGLAAIRMPDDALFDRLMLVSQVSTIAAVDLMWGPVLRTYPDLKIAWSEAGIGWIPFFLDRCDRYYLHHMGSRHDFGGKLPSEVFREHSLACFISDPTSLKLRHEIGIDNIAWECDYPHSDSIWPGAPEAVHADLVAAGCTDEEINKILWENSCRFFRWDPFERTPREEATVGALRAKATDVDTAIRGKAEWRKLYAARA
ncbi:amidohydrolase [Frankia sp. CNm7]|uniref:Amidohydrolase n=1 Tax=Frankia nepalensis TaxID=1836974 RepID=A0A937RPX5_9ACTN|nr:amidohydrolase family protein [Frankia nepalensis]MBL7500992.1 amidohydrolase [Frankia nepalensis]MBL7512462.1 amidohydrolase [Frankia nepalensis]MBL7521527.1 amidohydrolase [Frankia nepalensis]MBL7632764.1 amidohydrolase [Frankia nepalensis]